MTTDEETRKMACVIAEGIAERAMTAGLVTMACPQAFIDGAQQIEHYIGGGQDITINCTTPGMERFVRPGYDG